MQIKTSFKDFKDLSKSNRPVAISAVIQADQFTPIAIFEKVYRYFGNGILAEITNNSASEILMSFNPRGFFQIKNQVCEACLDGKTYCFEGAALDALRQFKEMAKVELMPISQGLAGGVVGLVSYDAVRLFEEKLNQTALNKDVPEFLFYCYKVNLVFDQDKHQLTLAVVTGVDSDLKQSYEETIQFLYTLLAVIEGPLNQAIHTENQDNNSSVSSDLSDTEYQLLVQKAKAYIQQGDIFQVVLSRSFQQTYRTSPFNIYRTLRRINPSPYLFYIDNGENIILGASPEKLVSVKNDRVETVPIAGTCKNLGPDSINALLNDEKELAEHMMLVDLSRNDLGKICVAGSVKVESLLVPKKAGNLLHLTTLISGELGGEFDALDALKAVFPAGTVSGAPKLRAMEIIDELETTPRGFYAGAFCLIDNLGNLDSAIVIRTMLLKDGIATVRAGAGIVFDSIPEKEAQESQAKATSVLRSIQIAEEESDVINH